jgi:hypothetical protein
MNEDYLWKIRGDEIDERSSNRSEEISQRDPALHQVQMKSSCSSHTTTHSAMSTFNAFKYFGLSSEKNKSTCKQGDEDHDVLWVFTPIKKKLP